MAQTYTEYQSRVHQDRQTPSRIKAGAWARLANQGTPPAERDAARGVLHPLNAAAPDADRRAKARAWALKQNKIDRALEASRSAS